MNITQFEERILQQRSTPHTASLMRRAAKFRLFSGLRCAVESTRRLVDARLEERLDNVRDGLREIMEEADRAPDA